MTESASDRMTNSSDRAAASARNEVEPVMVTMVLTSDDPGRLLEVLSTYAVLARGAPGCRNLDLVASTTRPGRYLIVQKWESIELQQRHFDSEVMVDMATSCTGLLSTPPDIDLHEPVSMHDLA